MTTLSGLRHEYHRQVGLQIVRFAGKGNREHPSFADSSSQSSVAIAQHLSERLGFKVIHGRIDGQKAGSLFEHLTCEFIASAFAVLYHLRPGKWAYLTAQTSISNFVQYQHLSTLGSLVKTDPVLAAALGHDYIITPDIVIIRQPVTDAEVNRHQALVADSEPVAKLTPFRASNQTGPTSRAFLHASISCKWTIRSDRSQNTRTEALNLIRNRKGAVPHIVAVTAEPLPMRIASLALGTGDIDCVYHLALPELQEACAASGRGDDQLEMLETMIGGNRLRDISDLPFDLAV